MGKPDDLENPVSINELSPESQERVQRVKQAIQDNTYDEGEKIIDDYVWDGLAKDGVDINKD